MTKRINIVPGAFVNGGPAIGIMMANGNPWTVPDSLADELVNRQKANSVDGPKRAVQLGEVTDIKRDFSGHMAVSSPPSMKNSGAGVSC